MRCASPGTIFIRRGLVVALVAALCVFMPRAWCQEVPGRLYFDHVSIPGNFRAAYASSILQDPEGLLWFGTSTGLYRFNGTAFTPFQYAAPDSTSLIGHEIQTLHWDRMGDRLLVGTQQSGLLAYSYRTDVLHSVGHSRVHINAIAQPEGGALWLLSLANGLYRLHGDSLTAHVEPSIKSPSALLAHGGAVIVGDIRQLVVLEGGRVKRTIPMAWPGKVFTPGSRFTALMIDDRSRLWAGTEKDGIIIYDYASGRPLAYISPEQRPFYSQVTRLLQDSRGLVWVLTKAEGLAVFNPNTLNHRYFKQNYAPSSLSGNTCYAMIEDNSGIVWIGTNGDINQYDRTKHKFEHYHHDALAPHSLSDNMVRSIYTDRDGLVWCGTNGGVINLIDPQSDSVGHIPVQLAGKQEIIVPFSFAERNAEEMFVGTSDGLMVLDKTKKTFSHYEPLKELTRGRRIRQMIRRGDTLYCLLAGHVVIHDMRKGDSQLYSKYNPDGPLEGNATYLYVDRSNSLWVATLHNSLSQFVPAERRFIHHPLAADTTRFMVLSVSEIDGQFWVTTLNGGMLVFEKNSEGRLQKVKRYTEKDGLPDNTIYGVLPDSRGDLWCSSNMGIIRFNRKENLFTRYYTSEGVQEEEFNRLAFGRTPDGALIFGGVNGVNLFWPEKLTMSRSLPMPQVFSITTTLSPRLETYTQYQLIGRRSISLAYTQNFFTLDFGTTDYHTPRRYRYRYMLEDFDRHWINSGEQSQAHYTGLSPGDYTFRLKVINDAGEERETLFRIHIIPPFWRTWWFMVLIVVVVSILITGMIQGRVQQDRIDRHRLEMLLTLRTAEIERSREELQALNQKKDLIFSILSHDLRSPLTTLKGFLSMLIDDGGNDMPREEIRKHAATIRNSVTNSLDLIDNTLFWSLSQMGNITYTPTRVSIYGLLNKVKGLYQLTATKKMVDLVIDVPEDLYVYGDENMIYVTFRNLISNALKFTPKGTVVTVRGKALETIAEVVITDQGVGMSEEELRKLLTLNEPVMLKRGTADEKGTGLGLHLCKSFIAQNKGRLFATSVVGKGTSFFVELPLDGVSST